MIKYLKKLTDNIVVKIPDLIVMWTYNLHLSQKNLCTYSGTIRATEVWDNIYKIRTIVESQINHIKENLCLARHHTQNEKTSMLI